MVTINVGILNCQIVGLYDWNVLKNLDRKLSYQVEGVEFIPSYIEGRWDGCIRLFNTRNKTFSTGLLNKVCSILDQCNIQYTINDLRKRPQLQTPIPINTKLRKDQEDVVRTLIAKGRGIAALPTGWG